MHSGQRLPSAYVVERQGFFAPYLAKTLAQAQLNILYVNDRVDFQYVGRHTPDVVFVDADYVTADIPATLRELRRRSARSVICLYTSHTELGWARTCFLAGANAIFTKFATGEELIDGLKTAMELGSFADRRLVPAAH